MPTPRHVALALDMDQQDRRWHDLALGAARFARQAPHWRLTLDPFPLDSPAGTYHGAITDRSDVARACLAAGMQAVCVSWHSFAARIPRVVADHREAGHLAANHLIGSGYRHLAYVGYCRDTHSRIQEAGFRTAARARGASVHVAVLPEVYFRKRERWAHPRSSLGRWLDSVPKPAGVFAFHDLFALHVSALCREKGLRVPDDVALVGAGNDAAVCGLADPPLSSIEFHYNEVGYRAAGYLDRLMAGGGREARAPRVAPSLVVRASSDRGAEADALVAAALRHIAEHSHEPLRVADVARAVGISPCVLRRRFQRVRGATIAQEIALVRTERARDLLAATGLSVAEVAARCGFGSAHRLALVFREQEGLSPREWRRRAAEASPESLAPLAQVKALLLGTGLPIAEVARQCGYRSARHLASVFREREAFTPEVYRRIYRPREAAPPIAEPGPVEIVLDGPPPPTEAEGRGQEI